MWNSSHILHIDKVPPQYAFSCGKLYSIFWWTTSHILHIDKVSPRYEVSCVQLDDFLKWNASHIPHIDKISPQYGVACISLDLFSQWISSHICHIDTVSPQYEFSCGKLDYIFGETLFTHFTMIRFLPSMKSRVRWASTGLVRRIVHYQWIIVKIKVNIEFYLWQIIKDCIIIVKQYIFSFKSYICSMLVFKTLLQ